MVETAIQTTYLRYDNPSKTATSFRVGNNFYPAPSFIPEIKGGEDLRVLLEHMDVLPVGNSVLVPSNKWDHIIKPFKFQYDLFGNDPPIKTFIENYPIIFYDPPEFFRYAYTKTFIRYALSNSTNTETDFKTKLTNKDISGALGLIPPFFQPFVEAQLDSICNSYKINAVIKKYNFDRAWLDPRIDVYYSIHMANVLNTAFKVRNSTIIPPYPN